MWNILKINHLTDSQASEAPLVAHPLGGVKPLFRNSFGCGQFRSSIRVFEELLLPSRMLRPREGRGSNASLAAGMVSHPGGISPGGRRNDPPFTLTPRFSLTYSGWRSTARIRESSRDRSISDFLPFDTGASNHALAAAGWTDPHIDLGTHGPA